MKIGEVVAMIDEGAVPPAEQTAANRRRNRRKQKPGPPEKRSAGAEALSPAVRRIVDEEKLDPDAISGSGKGGRITKGDALSAAEDQDGRRAASATGRRWRGR